MRAPPPCPLKGDERGNACSGISGGREEESGLGGELKWSLFHWRVKGSGGETKEELEREIMITAPEDCVERKEEGKHGKIMLI